MADSIPDLWSDTIRVDTLSPWNILQMQGAFLKKRTGGIVDGVVNRAESKEGTTVTLDIWATALNHRERVLTATYTATNKPYPVKVEAIGLPPVRNPSGVIDLSSTRTVRTVNSEEGFFAILRQSLQSEEMNTLIQSLIARTNELKPVRPEPPTAKPSPLREPLPERTVTSPNASGALPNIAEEGEETQS